MDILPTEEELMVKNLAREFLEGECPTSLVREMETDDLGYPPRFVEADGRPRLVRVGHP